MAFPERSERVGVVEGHAALLEIKAHPEPWRQGVRDARGGGGAIAVGDGVSDAVAMVTVVVVVVVVGLLGQVDLSHTHGEEAEGRRGI